MLSIALLALCAPFFQAQEEKKPAPETPAQEKKEPAPAPQEKKEPAPPPEEPAVEEEIGIRILPGLRGGGWSMGAFNATTPGGPRHIESSLLLDAGVDLQARLDGWTLALTGDYGSGHHFRVVTGGVLLGAAMAPEPDLELQFAAGPIFGRLDVDVAGFGNFKSSVGVDVRLSCVSWLHPHVGLSIWMDYRQIAFKYDEPITSGDRKAGGPMFAAGLGLLMRF